MPDYSSLSVTVVGGLLLARQAHELAAELRHHLPSVTDHQHHAGIHHLVTALADFGRSISHAEAGMTPSVRAAIGAR